MKRFIVFLVLISLFIPLQFYAQETVSQFGLKEITLTEEDLPSNLQSFLDQRNRFLKEEVRMLATITQPDNSTIEIGGFWYEPFEISETQVYVEGEGYPEGHWFYPYLAPQKAESIGDPEWRFRFTPTQVGFYTYSIQLQLDDEFTYDLSEFSGVFVSESLGEGSSEKGFLQHSNELGYHYEDQTQFQIAGFNLHNCPSHTPGGGKPVTNWAELYFQRMSEAGLNTARICFDEQSHLKLMPFNAGDLEDPYYDDEIYLPDAFFLDKIIELAEVYDINLQFRIFSHSDFSAIGECYTTEETYSGWAWDFQNVYNKNSEMCWYFGGNPPPEHGYFEEKHEFFTNEDAIRMQYNYISYLIDRYGYSTQISCWELCSEAENMFGVDEEQHYPVMVDWHANAIEFTKNYDPQHRVVTTALAAGVWRKDNPSIYALHEMVEVLHLHRYMDNVRLPNQGWNDNTAEDISFFGEHFPDKRIYLTEAGQFEGGWGKQEFLDPHGFGYHQALWTQLFTGISAPHFDWGWQSMIERDTPEMNASVYMNEITTINELYQDIPNLGGPEYHEQYIAMNCQGILEAHCHFAQNTFTSNVYGYILNGRFEFRHFIDGPDPNPNTDDTPNEQNVTMHPFISSFDLQDAPPLAECQISLPIEGLDQLTDYQLQVISTKDLSVVREEMINSGCEGEVNIAFLTSDFNAYHGDLTFSLKKIPSQTDAPLTENEWVKVWNNQSNGKIDFWEILEDDKITVGDFINAGTEQILISRSGNNSEMAMFEFEGNQWNSLWYNPSWSNLEISQYHGSFVVGNYDGVDADELYAHSENGDKLFRFVQGEWVTVWEMVQNHAVQPYEAFVSGDFTGDGKSELMGWALPISSGWITTFYFDESLNGGDFIWGCFSNYGRAHDLQNVLRKPIVGDFNGDGLDDIAGLMGDMQLLLAKHKKGKCAFQEAWSNNNSGYLNSWQLDNYFLTHGFVSLSSDFDGTDGKDELLLIDNQFYASDAASFDYTSDPSLWNTNWLASDSEELYFCDWELNNAINGVDFSAPKYIAGYFSSPYRSGVLGLKLPYNGCSFSAALFISETGTQKNNQDQHESKRNSSISLIYPNPTNSVLNIELCNEHLNSEVEISLSNSVGKLVKHKLYNTDLSTLQISCSDLTPGVYHVSISSSKYSESQRLVVD